MAIHAGSRPSEVNTTKRVTNPALGTAGQNDAELLNKGEVHHVVLGQKDHGHGLV